MMNVLIIDDSAIMRKIVARNFSEAGYAVKIFEANDGEEALSVFQREKIDLILCDWIMPKMSGIEFVKKIRGMGNRIPIIMITSQGTMSHMEEALRAGVNAYIVKPFTSLDLKSKVDRIFKRGEHA